MLYTFKTVPFLSFCEAVATTKCEMFKMSRALGKGKYFFCVRESFSV